MTMLAGDRLYVYYRVPQARLAATVAQVHAMQSVLQARFAGLRTGLLRRPELRDGEVTLMETYAGAADEAFAAALDAAAAALPQPRHTERFVPLD
jgi:hypothetical protein